VLQGLLRTQYTSYLLKASEADYNEPNFEEPEPEPEVVELVSSQEEIFSRPTKIVKLPIKTLVDFPIEPTMELVPALTAMRFLIFLRSPDVYDPLQIFF